MEEANTDRKYKVGDFDGLAQDCSNSIAFAMELLQSWAKILYLTLNLYVLNYFEKKI